MQPKNYFAKLLQGLVAGLFLVATIQPSLAVESISSPSPTAGKNLPAVQLTQQLEKLERFLSSLPSTSPSDRQAALNSQQARFQEIQQQIADYFKRNEVILHRNFSGSDLESALSRQKQATQQIKQRFEQLYQGFQSLRPGNFSLANLSALLTQVRDLLSFRHQSLNQEQLPTAILKLPKPEPALAKEFFGELPQKPQPQDLASTPETASSDLIESLVEQMQSDPQALYQWVCNQVDYRPGYGSMQGAELTLNNKTGNAWDQASLLIALLREAGIPTRYAYGQIQPTQKQLLSWLRVNSLKSAYQLLDQAGIPREGKNFAHIWVKAYLSQENRWVDLDPSFKQYSYRPTTVNPQDEVWLQSLLKFAQPGIQSQGSILPAQPKLEQAEIIPRQVNLDTDLNNPKRICWGQAYQLAPELSWKLKLSLAGDTHLFSLQEIAHQPLSIAYLPAQNIDGSIISCFVEQEGTILPAYLVELQPYLIVGNELIELGEPTQMGTPQTLTISWESPSGTDQQVKHILLAGMNAVWAANWGQISSSKQLPQKATSLKGKFYSYLIKSISQDCYLQPLTQVAMSYQRQNQRLGEIIARYSSFQFAPGLSESLVALAPQANFIFDIPTDFSFSGIQIDVQKDNFFLASLQEKAYANKNFLALKGALASALEHHVLETSPPLSPEETVNTISAIKVLALAIEQEIPIYTLDATNYAEFAKHLQLPCAIRQDLQLAVQTGKSIILPQQMLQLDDWEGIGYIVVDKSNGNNAYMLSGGLGGGFGSTSASANMSNTLRAVWPKSTMGKIIMMLLIIGLIVVAAA